MELSISIQFKADIPMEDAAAAMAGVAIAATQALGSFKDFAVDEMIELKVNSPYVNGAQLFRVE